MLQIFYTFLSGWTVTYAAVGILDFYHNPINLLFTGKSNCVSLPISSPSYKPQHQQKSATSSAGTSAAAAYSAAAAKRMRLDHPAVLFSPTNYSMSDSKDSSCSDFPFPYPFSSQTSADKLMSPKSASYSPPLSFKCHTAAAAAAASLKRKSNYV